MAERYHLEGLREEIRQCLLAVPRSRGGDGMVEASNRFNEKPFHTIQVDANTVIRTPAEPVRTLACKQFKTSSMPLPPWAFSQKKLVKIVKASSQGSWLMYCYSEGAQLPRRELLEELLHQFMRQEEKVLRGSSAELVKHLALLACQQKRDALNANTRQLLQTEIAALAKKTTKAWEKTWAVRWRRLLTILEKFDKEGLDDVYQRSRKGKAATRHANVPVQQSSPLSARTHLFTRVGVQ